MDGKSQSPTLVMRVIQIAFIVSGFLYLYIMTMIPSHAHRPPTPAVELAIAVVALTRVVVGFNTKRIFVCSSEGTPQDVSAQTQRSRWMTAGVMSLAFFEACILFGFVLHVLGARGWLVGLLFGIGIGSMIFWSPGEPPGAGDEEFLQS